MGSSQRPAGTISFGEFEVNLRSRELLRRGSKIKITDQSFCVLAMLLEHPGDLVTREELAKRLWPAETFVDFDHGVNNAVNRLREALGDSADAPRFVETLPRRGYRFAAASTVHPDGAASGISALSTGGDEYNAAIGAQTRKAAWPRGRRYVWMLVAVAATAALALVIVLKLPSKSSGPASRSFVLPPDGTTFRLIRDDGGSVALSPDGTKLAFVAVDGKGTARIWVRPLESLGAEELEGTEGASFPFWSPDGGSIGFFANGKLNKIGLAGGPALTLCEATAGRGGNWSRRGVIIFTPNTQSGIYQIADTGGTPSAVTTVDSAIHTTHRWPKFLPDGRHFIYLAANHFRDGSHDGVYLSAIDGKENKLIVLTHADATLASGYLFFLHKDVLMAQSFDARRGELQGDPRPTVEKVLYDPSIWKAVFDVSETGVMAYQLGSRVSGTQLRWFDRLGRDLGSVGEPGFQETPQLSPDGRKLLLSRVAGMGSYGDLWVYDLTRKFATRITFEDYDYAGGIWSRDGRRILVNARGQHSVIFELTSSGSGTKNPLLDTGVDIWGMDLSPDGQFLLYGQGYGPEQARSRIWVYPLNGKSAPFRLLEGEAKQSFGQFSPDGLWIAYMSNESGREEVYVVPFRARSNTSLNGNATTTGKWQLSPSGGDQPRWRRDGKELFYVSADSTLMAVPVAGRGSTFEAGIARPLFRPGGAIRFGFGFDVSADGSRFILNLNTTPEDTAPITLVQNWPSEFKK